MYMSMKQKVFVKEYLTCWNGTEAARRAGYKCPRQSATENLSKPYIMEAIDERLEALGMAADEALMRLSKQARGDLGDFMEISTMGFSIALLEKDAEGNFKRKNTHLLKKIKQKTTTIIGKSESADDREIHETEIELYDAQSALKTILQLHQQTRQPALKVEIEGFDALLDKVYSDAEDEEAQAE